MAEEVKRNREERLSEEAKYVNPRRRERVRTVEEERRRIRKP